jgi:F-type H+-transporting ATPase subunit b
MTMPTPDLYSPITQKGMLLVPAMAGGGGVNIDFDLTFVAQMVVFAGLVVILKPLLFDPVLKIFEQRERYTEGRKAEARELQEEAGTLLRKYERELERVNQVAAAERERLRAETSKLEAEILGEARVATTRIIDEGRRKIETDVNAIRFQLGRESERVAKEIAARVLGREVN